MKKWLLLLCAITSTQMAFADDATNIRIKISGASSDNRYFLCLPNVGCLSILGAQRGKVFPIFRPITMSAIYIEDVTNQIHLAPQGLPASCRGQIETNHTLTITGTLTGSGNNTHINGLHCTIS